MYQTFSQGFLSMMFEAETRHEIDYVSRLAKLRADNVTQQRLSRLHGLFTFT